MSEIKDWTIMPGFAHRDRTAVSVGEKAVLVLKARNRSSTKLGFHDQSCSFRLNICGKRNELFERPSGRSRLSGPPASSFQYQSANTRILVIQSALAERSNVFGVSRCCGIPLTKRIKEAIMAMVMMPLA